MARWRSPWAPLRPHVAGAVPEARELLRTGSDYQLWHALALLATALLMTRMQVGQPASLMSRRRHSRSACCCCSAYRSTGRRSAARAVLAPFGGTLLILGWLLLAASGLAACPGPE